MKIRIQDNSIRFRITLKELATITADGALKKLCALPGGTAFHYAVRHDREAPTSAAAIAAFSITLTLSSADLDTLADPTREGVYIHQEWTDQSGAAQRAMVAIEKDRPAATCKKIEAWIYDGHNGRESTLTPIPAGEP